MHIPISLLSESTEKIVDTRALIDSGARGTFIDQNFAKRLNLPMKKLETPLVARNVDGTLNKQGTIRYSIQLPLLINGRTQSTLFYVTGLGRQNILLGLPWLQEMNPDIDWKKGIFCWRKQWAEIIKRCGRKKETKKIEDQGRTKKKRKKKAKKPKTTVTVAYLIEDRLDENGEPEIVWINAKTTTSQLLAAEENKKRKEKTIDEVLPPAYHQYKHLFEKSTTEAFPPARPWDHEIKLKEGFVPKVFKTYALSPAESKELSNFLEENLRLGRIRPSQSPMGSPFFFVAKKDGKKLRPCQDYRYLNAWTVPNACPLPRTDQLMDRLKGSKYFTKLDIKWGYNNVRIKEEDRWKAAFKTEKGLFEPNVMFFGMRNSPATFQNMMNDIMDEPDEYVERLKAEGYMDDLLPHGATREECRLHGL